MKRNFTLSISLTLLITLLSVCTIRPMEWNTNNLIDKPLQTLDRMQEIRDKFYDTYQKDDLTTEHWHAIKDNDDDKKKLVDSIDYYKALEKQFREEFPIFLLAECTHEDSQEGVKYCSLSRIYQEKYRETFEQEVVSALITRINTHERPIEYASFASGGKFQDLVILAKALTQKPTSPLNIHLIDIRHDMYVDYRDAMNDNHQIYPNSTIDPTDKDPSGIIDELPFIQFINYLQKTFPQATLALHAHSNTKGYCDYLTKHHIAYPDILACADIQDEMSLSQGSTKDYFGLCMQTLQNNSSSANILLSKGGTNKADIVTISLHPASEHSEIVCPLLDITTPIYIQWKEIKT